jgi:AraC-like DNA-binding protein
MKKQYTSTLLKSEWPYYGILLDESHHSPDFSMDPITRDYFKVFYVIQGKTTLWIEDKFPIAMNEKEILAVPKGIKHLIKDSPKYGTTSIYILSIKDEAFKAGCEEANLLASLNSNMKLAHVKFSPLSEEFADIAQVLRKIKYEQARKGLNYELVIKSTVASLLVRIRRAFENRKKDTASDGPVSNRKKIKEIHHYITHNFFEPLTVSQLADMCSLSINGFTSLFKDQFNITPLQYLHKKRVDYAKVKLRKSNEKISAVCFDAGFNDLSFFYRVFKKFTGKSPLAYRQKRK